MSLYTWPRVNQHIYHKLSGPFQRYKHNITFLTAEVLHKFLFCARKRQHFIPWQVPSSYIGRENLFTGDDQPPNCDSISPSLIFCLVLYFYWIQYHSDTGDETMHLLWFIQYIVLVFKQNIKQRIITQKQKHEKAAVRLQWHDSVAQSGRNSRLIYQDSLYVTVPTNLISLTCQGPEDGQWV